MATSSLDPHVIKDRLVAELTRIIEEPTDPVEAFEEVAERSLSQPVTGELRGTEVLLSWTLTMLRFPDHESQRCLHQPRTFSSVRVV
jgi:hypothetical protein